MAGTNHVASRGMIPQGVTCKMHFRRKWIESSAVSLYPLPQVLFACFLSDDFAKCTRKRGSQNNILIGRKSRFVFHPYHIPLLMAYPEVSLHKAEPYVHPSAVSVHWKMPSMDIDLCKGVIRGCISAVPPPMVVFHTCQASL